MSILCTALINMGSRFTDVSAPSPSPRTDLTSNEIATYFRNTLGGVDLYFFYRPLGFSV